MGNIENYIKSHCCNADVRIVGRTSKHYECSECGNPCEVTWKINK